MFRNPLTDAIVVLVVLLLFFGPKRLPVLGRSLGQGMREFKDSITGKSGPDEDDSERPAVPSVSSQPAGAPPAQAPPAEQPVPAAPPQPQATAPTSSPEETAAQPPPPVASSERRS